MYKRMKEFLIQELKREAEEELQKVQNDPELRDLKAPDDIRERLFAEIDAREKASERRELTEEEEKLIEIGRLYIRRQKRYKYLVVAAVLVLIMAFGITAMGGPKKLVEDIRRMMMGRTQIGVDVDSRNFEPIIAIDEETGYQMVKDKWGVDPVRMQYYLEGVGFSKFKYDQISQLLQFEYKRDNQIKILYQVSPSHGTTSQMNDIEDVMIKKYHFEVQEQKVLVEEYDIDGRENSRWIVSFSYQNMQYFIWIEDETQSNMEKIVENLNFF